jgi:hypothetical protein
VLLFSPLLQLLVRLPSFLRPPTCMVESGNPMARQRAKLSLEALQKGKAIEHSEILLGTLRNLFFHLFSLSMRLLPMFLKVLKAWRGFGRGPLAGDLCAGGKSFKITTFIFSSQVRMLLKLVACCCCCCCCCCFGRDWLLTWWGLYLGERW